MNLFTPHERKALWFLLMLLAAGLIIRTARDVFSAPVLAEDAGYLTLFEAGAEAYRATSIDEPVAPIDINKATAAELRQLPGVGPVMAKKIIDYRRKNGYFLSVDGLINVDGVGPKRLERWRELLLVADSVSSAEPATIDGAQK